MKEEDRPNSWSGVSGAGFSHRCLLLGLGATQEKKVGQKGFVITITVILFKTMALFLIQRSFSTGMAKLNVFSRLNISYLSLGQ